jgi:SAM-dependent methyltransferase
MNNSISILKRCVNGLLGAFGLQLSRILPPIVAGSPRISGSFPPYEELHRIGTRQNYFIHDGYEHRKEYAYYDDRSNSDGWQDEVYRYAKEIAEAHNLQTVVDIGCGSGYKLLKYFRDQKTLGLDVAETYETLRRRYPQRQWGVGDFAGSAPADVDLVISADVIEHLLDPDQLLEFILRINPRYVVISTPDRNLMRRGVHHGPPANPKHIREWSMAELHAYLSVRFEILEHFHSNQAQSTQCVLARPGTAQQRRSA